MATAGQRTTTRSRAVDLSTVPLDGLEPAALAAVFAAQQQEWHERLGWDMAGIAGLITESLQAGALPGLALLDGPEPVGYGFYTKEPGRCLIKRCTKFHDAVADTRPYARFVQVRCRDCGIPACGRQDEHWLRLPICWRIGFALIWADH